MSAQDPAAHEGGDAPGATPIREPLPGIGERLRDRRVSRGQSFEEVENAIRVNSLYLQALEQEHYDALPAPVYARGFMRSYARHLGLDPEAAVSEMSGTLEPPTGLEPLPGLRRTPSSLPEFNRPLAGIIVAGAILVVLVLAAGSFLGGGSGLDIGGGSDAPPGPAASAPASGAQGTDAGATVVPAADPGTVPNFVGVARSAVLEYLDQQGVRSLVILSAEDEVPLGEVFRQSPAPGATLNGDTIVTLFVSSGPRDQ